MSNPSRKKGTQGENFFLRPLRTLFFPALDPSDDDGHPLQRAPLKGVKDYGDFLGVPWLHEAKHSAKPLFQAWARICEAKADKEWVILWKGDLRTRTGNGPYVLMPFEFYKTLAGFAIDGGMTYKRPRVG
jgi:hypothetical protein